MLGEGLLSKIKTAWQVGSDLLYPRDCVHCGQSVPDGAALRYLCPPCLLDVEIFKPPFCSTCGYPFYGVLAGSRSCPHCEELRPQFNLGRTAFHLQGPMRDLVHAFKYGTGHFALHDLLAVVLMSPGMKDYISGAVLVPVPLHPIRKWRRTFNQSELVAIELAQLVSGSRMEGLLRRTRWTGSQTRLSRKQRRRNMRGAFTLRRGSVLDPCARYVVVDDVFTTGSTLNACCAVLRKAGAVDLDILALGHG